MTDHEGDHVTPTPTVLPAPDAVKDDVAAASDLEQLLEQTAERLEAAGLIETVDDPDSDEPARPLTSEGFRTLVDLVTWWDLLSNAPSAGVEVRLTHDLASPFRLALIALMLADTPAAAATARRRAIGALRRANKTHTY